MHLKVYLGRTLNWGCILSSALGFWVGCGHGSGASSAGSTRTVASLQNSPTTGREFTQRALQRALTASEKNTSREGLMARLSLQTLGSMNWAELEKTVMNLSQLDFAEDETHQLGEDARYALGVAAVRFKRFALASEILSDLQESSRKELRAGAYNAKGVMALAGNKWPEAAFYFEKALAEDSQELAAQENLKTLKNYFGLLPSDRG